MKRLCNAPGCNETAEQGHIYCEKHLAESQKKHEEWLANKKKPFEKAKRTNSSLYNTAAWRHLRKSIIQRDGCCQQCGATEESSGFPLEVHHIRKPQGNSILFFDPDNCITLCKVCHSQITQQEVRR